MIAMGNIKIPDGPMWLLFSMNHGLGPHRRNIVLIM